MKVFIAISMILAIVFGINPASASVANLTGLVAHYQFNGNCNDYSGQKLHGNLDGATWTTDRNGSTNQALAFNGKNSGVKLSRFPAIFNGSLTVSMWVYFNDDSRAILFGSFNTANNVNFEKHTGNRLRIWWNNGQRDFYSPRNVVKQKTWHQVTFMRNKSVNKFYIYVDGKRVAETNNVGSDISPAGPFFIGRDSRTGSTVLNGKIDDLRIYRHALNSNEMAVLSDSPGTPTTTDAPAVSAPPATTHPGSPSDSLPPQNLSPIAHFKFDNNCSDHSGNNFHGTNVGATWTTDRQGIANKAIAFNGKNSGVKLSRFPAMFNGSLTVSMWVYFNDDSRAILFGSFNTANNVNFEKHTGNRLRIWWNNGQRDFYAPRNMVMQNKWHHVAYVRNKAANCLMIYVDGKEVARVHNAGSDVSPAGPFHIGRDSRTGSTVLNGRIDDLKLFNRALDQHEIALLFNQS